jgi:hypothetical protein
MLRGALTAHQMSCEGSTRTLVLATNALTISGGIYVGVPRACASVPAHEDAGSGPEVVAHSWSW